MGNAGASAVCGFPHDKQSAAGFEPRRIRFRIVHILYVIALLASSLATFGARGIVPALVVLGVWAVVFVSRSRPRALAAVGVLLWFGFCGSVLVLPALQGTRTGPSRMECPYKLKQIGFALRNYHDVYGTFPPAYVADKNGKPMHSWRVLILPFMEYREVYDAYDFTEPWDGPKNRKLAASVPEIYVCPDRPTSGGQGGSHPSYFAVIGPRTVWPGAESRQIGEIKDADGLSQTLMVVESHLPDVAWSEPRDLSFDEAMRLLSSQDSSRLGGHLIEDFFYERYSGRHAVLADGSVHFLRPGLPRDTAVAVLTIDDGRSLEEEWYRPRIVAQERLKVGNCYRLAVFAALCLFPLPWVWISPRHAAKRETAAQAAGLRS